MRGTGRSGRTCIIHCKGGSATHQSWRLCTTEERGWSHLSISTAHSPFREFLLCRTPGETHPQGVKPLGTPSAGHHSPTLLTFNTPLSAPSIFSRAPLRVHLSIAWHLSTSVWACPIKFSWKDVFGRGRLPVVGPSVSFRYCHFLPACCDKKGCYLSGAISKRGDDWIIEVAYMDGKHGSIFRQETLLNKGHFRFSILQEK